MSNFTISEPLFLVPCRENSSEKTELDAFIRLLDESGAFGIIGEYDAVASATGRPRFDSKMLLALLLYGFSICDCSLRELEDRCRYDMRFLYLSSGRVPSYATFCSFINKSFLPRSVRILTAVTKKAAEKMGVSILENVYIDGSKFEANANKYKFRFKSEKRVSNLYGRFSSLMTEVGIKAATGIGMKEMIAEMERCLSLLKEEIEKDGKRVEDIKTGRGIRNPRNESSYVKACAMLSKMKEYEMTEKICGPDRNSYYLTDHDATAMCLKEDYYSGLGSNMHAAYNVQYAVSNGFIIAIHVSQDRSDSRTFPIFLKKIKQMYGRFPTNVCADAEYGSARNYEFIRNEGIGNYVKFTTWKKEVSGEQPPRYRIDGNGKIVCLLGRELARVEDEKDKSEKRRFSSYRADCRGCPYKKYCNKGRKAKRAASKVFEIDVKALKSKEEARANLLSVKGIELRVNRSIQVEGSFGIMKQDKQYARFRRRSLERTDVEMLLNCIGLNIAKYMRFLRTGHSPEYWKAPEGTEAEKEHKISRTIKKGGRKAQKKQPNEKARKYKYREAKRKG